MFNIATSSRSRGNSGSSSDSNRELDPHIIDTRKLKPVIAKTTTFRDDDNNLVIGEEDLH